MQTKTIYDTFVSSHAPFQDSTIKKLNPNKPLTGKILVIDDEIILRLVLNRILSHNGYNVSTAVNSLEAIQQVKDACDENKPFDIVLIDLYGCGEPDALQTLIKLYVYDSTIKTILTTGNTYDPIFINFQKHGFTAALKKPFEIKELIQTINALLLHDQDQQERDAH